MGNCQSRPGLQIPSTGPPLQQVDGASNQVAANFSLYFTLQLSVFFGFRFSDIDAALLKQENIYLDLQEGVFTHLHPTHPNFIEKEDALITSELLKIMQPQELEQVKMNHHKRRALLNKYLEYYALHIHDFGQMKTLKVLQEVLG